MKNLYQAILVIILVASFNLSAQAPQKMSYQAVIRNASGTLVSLTPVGIKISILQGSVSGSAVYVETHSAMTSSNGLLSIEIGGGNVQSGSFTAIAWANGPYFVKTETDPNGGSNYTISGTSQLLSVPYALYAENTKFQGKSTIYLSGDITDAEAAERLANDIGPNTENITIFNTTVLTTVDLSGLEHLINITVTDNTALTVLEFPDLTKVDGNITIEKNAALQTVEFSALSKVAGKTLIKSNAVLTDINLSALLILQKTVAGGFVLEVSENPLLTTMDLISLQISYGYILVTKNHQINSITFPSLYKSSLIRIWDNDNLLTVDFPSLVDLYIGPASYSLSISNNDLLSTINLPLLVGLQSLALVYNPNLITVNMPSITSCSLEIINTKLASLATNLSSGNVILQDNAFLMSVSLPNLTSSYIKIINNQLLTSIAFPNFNNATSNLLEFYNNRLPSSEVNFLLNKFLTVTPLSGKTIKLKQLPPAPPTGQGIIDKAALISAGNTVETN